MTPAEQGSQAARLEDGNEAQRNENQSGETPEGDHRNQKNKQGNSQKFDLLTRIRPVDCPGAKTVQPERAEETQAGQPAKSEEPDKMNEANGGGEEGSNKIFSPKMTRRDP